MILKSEALDRATRAKAERFGTEEKLLLRNEDQIIEEMAELMKEIIKRRRGRENREEYEEEIADVYLSLELLVRSLRIDREQILARVDQKANRLSDRLNEKAILAQLTKAAEAS